MTDLSAVKEKEHVPDPSRLPKCVTSWQPMDLTRLWEDATQILVAVPVCGRTEFANRRDPRTWYYEYCVVVIRCDEDYFDVETSEGDDWGWDLSAVDFYVELK